MLGTLSILSSLCLCLLVAQIRWSLVVVDEGQRLKNRKASMLAALSSLNIRRRVLLSGTPLQNNTEELWSLMNFVEPVKFHSLTAFQESYKDMKSAAQVEKLAASIKPYILRRLKEDVEKSIPKKEETIIDVELTMIQVPLSPSRGLLVSIILGLLLSRASSRRKSTTAPSSSATASF